MKTYGFTIVLKDINVMTEQLANDLYEAGCSGGSPFSGNGIAGVSFDRDDAVSLEEAIKSAVADVEKAGQQIARIELEKEEIIALGT